ncbi:MAG TPA: hypothetical protein VLL74_02760 [Methanoregula sp.]|nr:hypothetical protein [Methanoregula sp.]
MLWKNRSARNKEKRPGGERDLLSRIRADIPVRRKQGLPPEKDPATFSRYHCDLCNSSFSLNELRQCTLCGRWACPSCWTEEYYICNSCNGILRLYLIQEPAKSGSRK